MTLFTVEQADRTLPLVRRIVEDIVRQHRVWQEKVVELDLLSSSTRAELRDPRIMKAEKEIRGLAADIDGYEAELSALGIQLKDRRIGLIDFPSNLDGRRVLLCWRLGEPSIQFWHDENSGYAGRQPLLPTFVG